MAGRQDFLLAHKIEDLRQWVFDLADVVGKPDARRGAIRPVRLYSRQAPGDCWAPWGHPRGFVGDRYPLVLSGPRWFQPLLWAPLAPAGRSNWGPTPLQVFVDAWTIPE
jgi:hypothetical protein